ncbi:hypothetical protein B0H19DRAFT_935279, partial [Mycena capillaripes]
MHSPPAAWASPSPPTAPSIGRKFKPPLIRPAPSPTSSHGHALSSIIARSLGRLHPAPRVPRWLHVRATAAAAAARTRAIPPPPGRPPRRRSRSHRAWRVRALPAPRHHPQCAYGPALGWARRRKRRTGDVATKLSDTVRRRCFNCCTTDTSTRRRSNLSPGKVLCNKCGLFERTHSRPRTERFPHKRGPI